MSFKHVMIDIETLGSAGCLVPIIQIALFAFGEKNSDTYSHCFSIDLEKQIEAGIHPQPKTIEWWEKENRALLESILSDPAKISPTEVLPTIRKFFQHVDPTKSALVWAKSPSFDLVKIGEFSNAVGTGYWMPWSFRNERCVRTIVEAFGTEEHPHTPFAPVSMIAGHTKHDALYDCMTQANAILHAIKRRNQLEQAALKYFGASK